MTSVRDSGALPRRAELDAVCAALGLDSRGARMLPSRSNAVFHLPALDVAVRLSTDTPTHRARAHLVVSLTRWVVEHGGPALAPTSHPQPVREAGTIATFWPYLPPSATPRARDLAGAVRELHRLDAQYPSLPGHQPMSRLREALELDATRDQPTLPAATHDWIRARAARLQHAYETTPTPLGRGLIHADVQLDNLLRDRDGRWLLIDWDRASHGPRELDLTFGVPTRFHKPADAQAEFRAAYGYDVTAWSGWPLIRDLTELHALASYLRRAPANPAARAELHRRVSSLLTDDRSVVWRTVTD